MRSKKTLIYGVVGLVVALAAAWFYMQSQTGQPDPAASPVSIKPTAVAPAPEASVTPAASPLTAASTTPQASASPAVAVAPAVVDLAVDASGLSKATVVMQTSKGVVKFKFYSQDAPNTVARMVALIQQKFYDGLAFHRVVPGFVVQGGDPLGNGTGGSGQKLKAEFNKRRHLEGTVAMARAADPDSADSQFYIALGQHPHLDGSYTVFGQVTEGMDAVRKLAVGDKMISVRIE